MIDIAKGIGILLVILGHGLLSPSLHYAVYSFHMPLFFVLSGYCFSERQNWKRDFHSLILPFVLTVIICSVLYLCAGKFEEVSSRLFSLFLPRGFQSSFFTIDCSSGPVWFLVALFWCRLIFRRIKEQHYVLFFAFVISIVSVYCHNYLFSLPLGFDLGAQAVMIYAIGELIKRKAHTRSKILTLSSLMLIPLWLVCLPYIRIDMAECLYQPCYLSVIVSMGGVIGVLIVSEFLKRINCSKIFTYSGRNSLYILCAHTVLITVIGAWGIASMKAGIANLILSLLFPACLDTVKRLYNEK